MNRTEQIINYVNQLENQLNQSGDAQDILSQLHNKYVSTNKWFLGIALGNIFTKHGIYLTNNLLASLMYNGLSNVHFDNRKWLGKYLEDNQDKFVFYPNVKKDITKNFVISCLNYIKQHANKIAKKDAISDRKYGKDKSQAIIPNN